MSKYFKFIRWALLGVISIAFLYAGVMKLLGKENAEFASWGFQIWVVYVVGAFQAFGALGLFYRPLVKLSIFILTVITMAALLTLAGKHQFYPDLILPTVYLLSIFGIMYLKANRVDPETRWGLL